MHLLATREDEVSGLKFAQARFYSANTGRFQSEDNVKGFIESPFTLNHYGYCWGNPIYFADLDGNMPYIIAGALVGAVVGGGMELVTQITTGEEIDGWSIFSAAAGGAVSGLIITACPTAAVSSTVVGGIAERTLDGVLHHDSAKDIAVDVGVGAVTDAAFANFGKYVAKTPFVKNAAEAFNATKIGGKIDKVTKKADRYYRSAMSRARNTGTEVHSKTIMNDITELIT